MSPRVWMGMIVRMREDHFDNKDEQVDANRGERVLYIHVFTCVTWLFVGAGAGGEVLRNGSTRFSMSLSKLGSPQVTPYTQLPLDIPQATIPAREAFCC